MSLNDKEMMTDLLLGEKLLASTYNTFCCEAATPAVRSSFSSLLQDEHRLAENVFREMENRSWYPVEKAEETKVHQARMNFAKTVNV